jgi:hypothetical protein
MLYCIVNLFAVLRSQVGEHAVQDRLQLRLGLVPDSDVADELVGVSRGQSDLVGEAKSAVDGIFCTPDQVSFLRIVIECMY